MFQKILVAIDQSEVSQQAFDEAIALAKATHANLMLVYVLSPLGQEYTSPVFPSDPSYPGLQAEAMRVHLQQWETLEKQGLEFLKSRADRAIAAGVATEFTQSLGEPGQAICELARIWGAHLIVIGRRGYSGLTELLLSSVSNHVAHHAPCSVLIVQHPEPVSAS
ncbi:universal stress protein [Pantanalinema rosaneae CENA516]|uniref:universal stress protein n=1 Tax=Pantanalinema rosaneae TaxID=1620701 RepID=UPI003D6E6BE9